jgi:hypothetical protein
MVSNENGEKELSPLAKVAGNVSAWYSNNPWVRALFVSIPVVGGAADTLFAWKGQVLARERIESLIDNVQAKLGDVDVSKLEEFVSSPDFIEIAHRSFSVASQAASEKKREWIAKYLAGLIRSTNINDYSRMISVDIEMLQEQHLEVLSALPGEPGTGVNKEYPSEILNEMNIDVYKKAMSDLERIGLISYDTAGIGTLGGGGGLWVTTGYLKSFKDHFGI